jgi:hypothetical protein
MRGRIMTTGIFEAYLLAVVATDAFGRDAAKAELLEDYEALCIEIERDVVWMLRPP